MAVDVHLSVCCLARGCGASCWDLAQSLGERTSGKGRKGTWVKSQSQERTWDVALASEGISLMNVH